MTETETLTVPLILLRLLIAGIIGGMIGYERRMHHKSIGIAGMMLVAVGSAGYMLLAKHLSGSDPASLSHARASGCSRRWSPQRHRTSPGKRRT